MKFTPEEVAQMAQEVGLEVHPRKGHIRVGMDALTGLDSTEKIERLVAIVAEKAEQAEREACTKVAGRYVTKVGDVAWAIEEEIRTRGQT
jgi:hypothetical protein